MTENNKQITRHDNPKAKFDIAAFVRKREKRYLTLKSTTKVDVYKTDENEDLA